MTFSRFCLFVDLIHHYFCLGSRSSSPFHFLQHCRRRSVHSDRGTLYSARIDTVQFESILVVSPKELCEILQSIDRASFTISSMLTVRATAKLFAELIICAQRESSYWLFGTDEMINYEKSSNPTEALTLYRQSGHIAMDCIKNCPKRRKSMN